MFWESGDLAEVRAQLAALLDELSSLLHPWVDHSPHIDA